MSLLIQIDLAADYHGGLRTDESERVTRHNAMIDRSVAINRVKDKAFANHITEVER